MRHIFSTLILAAFVLAGCGSNTSQTRNDGVAAQQLLPAIAGYTASNVDSLVDALTAAGAGASLTTGNLPVAAAIARAETTLQCLQDRGAVGGQSYVQQVLSDLVPEAGVVVIVNNDRLGENFLGCLLTAGSERFSAQAVQIQPCAQAGTFTHENNNYSYVYVGVGDALCGYFVQHFTSLNAVPGG